MPKLTSIQLIELHKCSDPITGPEYFLSNFAHTRCPVYHIVKFEPYDFQYAMLNLWHNHDVSISVIARQMGTTYLAAAYLLWYAMFNENSSIVLIGDRSATALEFIKKVRFIYEQLPQHIAVGFSRITGAYITFDNGSTIKSHPSDSRALIGGRPDITFYDNYAYHTTDFYEHYKHSGKHIITSSVNTDSDLFSRMYDNAYNLKITKAQFDWTMHPERDAVWEEEHRILLGDMWFDREFGCKFAPRNQYEQVK